MRLKDFLLKNKITLTIFSLVFFGYLINLPIDYTKSINTGVFRRLLTSYDVTSATFLPYEIINNGTLYFSQNTIDGMKRVQGPTVHSVMLVGDKHYSSYPILSGLMAIPFYMLPVLLKKIPALYYVEDLTRLLALGRISASFYTALSVTIFYLILKEIDKIKGFKSGRWIYLFMLFYSFGTNIYAIASRALWQHTSSLLFISLIIYFLLKGLDDKRYIKWLGLFAGLLYLSRPLNIVFILALTFYVFLRHRKEFIHYILYALPPLIFLLCYNYFAFGHPFTSEYMVKGDTQFSTPLIEGVIGNLFSPARSFIFITPPLFVSYYVMARVLIKSKKSDLDQILTLLTVTYIAIFLLYSTWWCWYGADRFGYGFFTEWVPIAAILTYIFFKPSNRIFKIIFFTLACWSLFTQFNAVWYRKSRCSGDEHNWTFYCLKPLIFTTQHY